MSGPSRSCRAYLLGVAFLVSGSARAQEPHLADPEPPAKVQAEYRDVVDRAIAEFDVGHVAEARALFLRAHELWPSARTRRTLGMTAFELRMYPRALLELQSALDDPNRPLPPDQRTEVAALIERTNGFVGRYRLQVTPGDAELQVDGAHVPSEGTLVLGVGVHQLLARAPGHELRRELVVQGRENEGLVLQLTAANAEPRPPPPAASAAVPPPIAEDHRRDGPNHTPAIIAFSVGGAGVIAGTVSGLVAFSKKRDSNLEAGHRAADISTASWITGGVGALAGVLFLVFEREPTREDQVLQLRVGAGALGLEYAF